MSFCNCKWLYLSETHNSIQYVENSWVSRIVPITVSTVNIMLKTNVQTIGAFIEGYNAIFITECFSILNCLGCVIHLIALSFWSFLQLFLSQPSYIKIKCYLHNWVLRYSTLTFIHTVGNADLTCFGLKQAKVCVWVEHIKISAEIVCGVGHRSCEVSSNQSIHKECLHYLKENVFHELQTCRVCTLLW